jgi:hypothetical protein
MPQYSREPHNPKLYQHFSSIGAVFPLILLSPKVAILQKAGARLVTRDKRSYWESYPKPKITFGKTSRGCNGSHTFGREILSGYIFSSANLTDWQLAWPVHQRTVSPQGMPTTSSPGKTIFGPETNPKWADYRRWQFYQHLELGSFQKITEREFCNQRADMVSKMIVGPLGNLDEGANFLPCFARSGMPRCSARRQIG